MKESSSLFWLSLPTTAFSSELVSLIKEISDSEAVSLSAKTKETEVETSKTNVRKILKNFEFF